MLLIINDYFTLSIEFYLTLLRNSFSCCFGTEYSLNCTIIVLFLAEIAFFGFKNYLVLAKFFFFVILDLEVFFPSLAVS